MQGHQSQPYTQLGQRLKHFREKRQESLAEVSGAVEIETELLERIERGEECPSEDILNLLINHFDLREQEAVQLWEWAGFSRNDTRMEMLQELASKAAVVIVTMDARVMYTDSATIASDDKGVVLSFMQAGPQGQELPISRVGMSYEQAAQVMASLQRALLRKQYAPKYKLLPPGNGAA